MIVEFKIQKVKNSRYLSNCYRYVFPIVEFECYRFIHMNYRLHYTIRRIDDIFDVVITKKIVNV